MHLCSDLKSSFSDSPIFSILLSSKKRTRESGYPILLSLNSQQVSSVDICSNDTLLVCPFLNDGRVSVSMPTMSYSDIVLSALSASASVSTMLMVPPKDSTGISLISSLVILSLVKIIRCLCESVFNGCGNSRLHGSRLHRPSDCCNIHCAVLSVR